MANVDAAHYARILRGAREDVYVLATRRGLNLRSLSVEFDMGRGSGPHDVHVLTLSTTDQVVVVEGPNIPHDWVVLECRVFDQRLSRYHIEGPLPQQFEFGGKRYPTHAIIEKLNPVSLLIRILYAMGVPFDAVDRRQELPSRTVFESAG